MAGNPELLRLVDYYHREKGISVERLLFALESAIGAAVHKKYSETDDVRVQIDRTSGEIRAWRNGTMLNMTSGELGRIAAQTAKQVIIQQIRDAEQEAVISVYADRMGELVTGTIVRFERDDVVIDLGGGAEAVLPRTDRVRGENYHVGDHINCVIINVMKYGPRVRIILSRTTPDLVRRLFEREVPEVAEGIIQIVALAREPGYRSKMGVTSSDARIDCVGACVGVRGSRIRKITDELGGEKIDIIKWNDSAEVLVMNALQPAEIKSITLFEEEGKAEVVVDDEQLSLAIGRRGQNVRLAAKLTGWDINIVSGSDDSVQAQAAAADEFDAGMEQGGHERGDGASG